MSRCWLAAKEWERCLESSQRGLAISQEIGSQENLVDLYASIGEAYLGMADSPKASQACQKAFALLEGDHPSLDRARILRLRGNIASQEEDYDRAAKWLHESLDMFTWLNNRLEMGRTLISLAVLAAQSKDPGTARIRLGEAKLIFRQLGAKLDLAAADAYRST
jgi:tetratricopeptide (TPR) repeat protein